MEQILLNGLAIFAICILSISLINYIFENYLDDF